MDHACLKEIASNEVLRKRLAKCMALQCFRNSKLEDLHAGVYPDSQAKDYSDVKVVSPFGEIAWQKLSRLSDQEMRTLMIDVVNRCYGLLSELLNSPGADRIIATLKERDPLPRWNDPEDPPAGDRRRSADRRISLPDPASTAELARHALPVTTNDSNRPPSSGGCVRAPWNKGKLAGRSDPCGRGMFGRDRAKLQLERRVRDLALFNPCHGEQAARLRSGGTGVDDMAPHGRAVDRANLRQRKSARPVRFEFNGGDTAGRRSARFASLKCLTPHRRKNPLWLTTL